MSVICYNIPSPLLLRQTDLFASDLRYVLPINRRLGPGALLEILRKGELPGSLENDIRYKDHDSQNLNHTLWTAYTCVTYVASFLPPPPFELWSKYQLYHYELPEMWRLFRRPLYG